MKEKEEVSLPVTQKQGAGCAVACVAYILNISYDAALKLFSKPKQAIGKGFLCKEIIDALKKEGLDYVYGKVTPIRKKLLKIPYTIVFTTRSKKYPIGHFLVRTRNGLWMNPWQNFPCIAPAQAGFDRKLPGKAEWIIYSR